MKSTISRIYHLKTLLLRSNSDRLDARKNSLSLSLSLRRPAFSTSRLYLRGIRVSTLQNLTRPVGTGAERPRGARLRRGAAAYGVAFPALQTPILAQKIARAPRAQPHLSRRAPRAAPPSGRAPRAASNLQANPISLGHQVLQRGPAQSKNAIN